MASDGRWALSLQRTAPIQVAGSIAKTWHARKAKWGRARRKWTSCGYSSTILRFLRLRSSAWEMRCGQFQPRSRENVQVVYTAHSIPLSMANTSDYVTQLQEVRRLVSAELGQTKDALVYQSRSGAPSQPWLEPDILDYLRRVRAENLASAVVLAPIGFLSDHMEVLYDLDVAARQLCVSLELPMARAETVGVHPKFIRMIRELVLERTNPGV